jgi:hypothetical protein
MKKTVSSKKDGNVAFNKARHDNYCKVRITSVILILGSVSECYFPLNTKL